MARTRWTGADLRSLQQRAWRAQLGVVFQENFLFDSTVRENIRLGQHDATDEMVEAATRAAEIHDAIVRLPDGYDSHMGALVRDPAILLLDEAGSALDHQTEARLPRHAGGCRRADRDLVDASPGVDGERRSGDRAAEETHRRGTKALARVSGGTVQRRKLR